MQNPADYIPNIEPFDISPRPRGLNVAIVTADLPNAINQGVSANAAYRAYQEAGVGMNRANFLSLYADIKSQLSGPINRPDQLLLSELTSANGQTPLEHESKYRYKEVLNIAVFDNVTGEVATRLHAVYHNEPMTVEEAQQEALAFYQEGSTTPGSSKTALAASLQMSFLNQHFVSSGAF
jgi:hypothetical protein